MIELKVYDTILVENTKSHLKLAKTPCLREIFLKIVLRKRSLISNNIIFPQYGVAYFY